MQRRMNRAVSEHSQLFLQDKAAKREKTGRFFLLFVVLSCIGLLGWGASRVQNKDYDFKKGANRTDTEGKPIEASPASFILSFVVGQVGGWFFWFFIWLIVFKAKYVPCQDAKQRTPFALYFNVYRYSRMRTDDKDIRVRMLDNLPIDSSHIANHGAYSFDNLGSSSSAQQVYALPAVHHHTQFAQNTNQYDAQGQLQPQAYSAAPPSYYPAQEQYPGQQQYPPQPQYPAQQQYYYAQQ